MEIALASTASSDVHIKVTLVSSVAELCSAFLIPLDAPVIPARKVSPVWLVSASEGPNTMLTGSLVQICIG